MSGHSKWANIKHKKGAADAKKGRIFSKLAKEIMVAVKQSGKEPDTNPKLRMCLTEARAANMPRENIERAIKKGAGELGILAALAEARAIRSLMLVEGSLPPTFVATMISFASLEKA